MRPFGTLSLLPPLAITGIGSLPHTQHELGLQMALQVDLPYLPQMPANTPSELMIASVLEGLPGLTFSDDALCQVDLKAWEAGQGALGQRLEAAFASGNFTGFEPTPEGCKAWRPFIWEVENRHLAFAKVQLSGPFTVRWSTRTQDGTPILEIPALDAQIYRLLLARGLAMVKAVRRAGATPLCYLDEPGLYALNPRSPRDMLMLQELRVFILALQSENALVGVHCCGNTRWDAILALPAQIVSLDARLSLDAVLEDGPPFLRFLERGGTLSLGIVPTNLAAEEFKPDELVDSVEASLRATIAGKRQFNEALSRMLLTPACGLAMRSVPDAERIFQLVRTAQLRLRQVCLPTRETTALRSLQAS